VTYTLVGRWACFTHCLAGGCVLHIDLQVDVSYTLVGRWACLTQCVLQCVNLLYCGENLIIIIIVSVVDVAGIL